MNVLHTSASVPRIPILPLMRKRNLYELTQDDINEIVTLALPKLLALGKAKEKQVFLLLFSRFFVTLPQNSR